MSQSGLGGQRNRDRVRSWAALCAYETLLYSGALTLEWPVIRYDEINMSQEPEKFPDRSYNEDYDYSSAETIRYVPFFFSIKNSMKT